MARERMITRTVNSTVYDCMVVDSVTKMVETIEVTISSAETITTKALDKAIRNAIPTGKLFVQTVSSKHVETLYGMTEADFIKFAKVLPPRTKVDTEVE